MQQTPLPPKTRIVVRDRSTQMWDVSMFLEDTKQMSALRICRRSGNGSHGGLRTRRPRPAGRGEEAKTGLSQKLVFNQPYQQATPTTLTHRVKETTRRGPREDG